MRTTNAQSHPLQFSVLDRTRPGEEPAVVGIHEQDDPNDGFLVMLTNASGRCSVTLTEPELQTLGRLIQQRFGAQDPLIGQFFHTYEDEGITRQGHVGGVVQPGHYVGTPLPQPDRPRSNCHLPMVGWHGQKLPRDRI